MTDVTKNTDNPFEVRVTADAHFSWIRTRMSVENTLLAWVRTAASLISFGFTIVQFFQRLAPKETGPRPLIPGATRDMGLALILAGILALAVATVQYRRQDQYLRSSGFEVLAGAVAARYRSATPVMAILLFLIGLFAFISVAFRLT